MKRPEKYEHPEIYPNCYVYKCTDIDSLLDRLEELEAEEIRNNTYPNKVGKEAYRFSADGTLYCNPVDADKNPFPSLDEFREWYLNRARYFTDIYKYFSQFQYEKTVFPKVGDMVEGESIHSGTTEKGEIDCTVIKGRSGNHFYIKNIRPVTTPTREEVIAQVESKLKSNELTFDRELVEQFLNILKGQDNG
jgi:hypothetical protein